MFIRQGAATRRGLLTAVGAALLLPGTGRARMPAGQPQAPYLYRFKLGTAECTVVTDGQLPLGDPNAAFLNITKDEIGRQLRDNFLPPANAVLEQNILVVNFGDRVVLFDTGMGTDTLFGKTTGKLLPALRAAAGTSMVRYERSVSTSAALEVAVSPRLSPRRWASVAASLNAPQALAALPSCL